MNPIEDVELSCPYCGGMFAIEVDTGTARTDLIEDCAVCCRPIQLAIRCEGGEVVAVDASRA